MSMQQGKVNLSIYLASSAMPDAETIILQAAAKRAVPISVAEELPDGESFGWASGRVLLDGDITAENSVIEGCTVLNFRRTAKKINSGMLKAVIQREEAAFKQANKIDYVPSRARKEIKEEAVMRLANKAVMTVRGVEVALLDEFILIGSTSDRDCDTVMTHLHKDMKIEIKRQEHKDRDGFSIDAGRKFLTWLFGKIQRDGNDFEGGNQLMIDGPLELVADSESDAKCTIANLKGGMVVKSSEVATALVTEKKMIRKAKLTLVRGEEFWNFTFDADSWSFASLELPRSCECFADRVESILELNRELNGIFAAWIFETEEQ